MANIQYLIIDGERLPLPTSYNIDLNDVEAESSGETEAGTFQRDIIRAGVVSISVSFTVSAIWLRKLTELKMRDYLVVDYFSPEILAVIRTEMFIKNYKIRLIKDTDRKGLWSVSFELQEI